MKGRLYFTTKAQKEGKIMIKTHPCARIFCCRFCGFEQVDGCGQNCGQGCRQHFCAVSRAEHGSLPVPQPGKCSRAPAAPAGGRRAVLWGAGGEAHG